MTVRMAASLKNAMLDAYESHVGASPKIQIRTGPQPTNLTDPDIGTLLAEITAPADYMNAASGGAKTLQGSWTIAGVATGTAGHYRLKQNGGTIMEDGTISSTGGGGDMTLNNTSIATGQTVTITSFTKSI